ncbi:hypothetical protein EUZ93_04245 [Wolbachia pipientis]|nr:hypothetical protein [Wolbachia pipientis]
MVGIVGGIVGAISIIPLIVAYILLSIAWKGLTQQPNDYQPLFLTPFLFIGNIVVGAIISSSGGSASAKLEVMKSAGIAIAETPAVIGKKVLEVNATN